MTRFRLLLLGLFVTPLAAVACSSGADAVKESAIEKVAVGTWRCDVDVEGTNDTPFTATIREGGFSLDLDDPAAANTKLAGTWSVEDGDLAIEFTGAAAEAPGMAIDDFDQLDLDSTGFTLSQSGVVAQEAGPD